MNTQELIYKVDYYEDGKVSYERYYLNDKLHRENGPAFIAYDENGKVYYESYYLNGKRHRENGPAYIAYHENGKVSSENYYLNDKLHRENGPAIITDNKNGKVSYEEYYLKGIYFTKEDWEKEIKKTIPVNNNNNQTKLLEEVKVINGRLVEIQKLLKT
jgi:antitoxin component YwqK of YwqJK toxin-antitoxin module